MARLYSNENFPFPVVAELRRRDDPIAQNTYFLYDRRMKGDSYDDGC